MYERKASSKENVALDGETRLYSYFRSFMGFLYPNIPNSKVSDINSFFKLFVFFLFFLPKLYFHQTNICWLQKKSYHITVNTAGSSPIVRTPARVIHHRDFFLSWCH